MDGSFIVWQGTQNKKFDYKERFGIKTYLHSNINVNILDSEDGSFHYIAFILSKLTYIDPLKLKNFPAKWHRSGTTFTS